MGLRIDIGSGFKKTPGILRLDRDPRVEPDYVVDFEKDRLPFDDNTVEYVLATHILEHIGAGFFHLMQEIYRVCKPGAKFYIQVPFFRHRCFFMDPTHVRPITVTTMMHFSKDYCDWSKQVYNSSSGMAYEYDVDFKHIKHQYDIDKHYVKIAEEKQKQLSDEDFREWLESTNNVIEILHIVMEVVK